MTPEIYGNGVMDNVSFNVDLLMGYCCPTVIFIKATDS